MVIVCTSCASSDCASRQNTESSSRIAELHLGANSDYSSGKNMGSTDRTSAQPLFDTSNTSSASTSASVLAELRSSAFTSPKFGGSTFSFQNEGNGLQQSNSTVSLPRSSSFSFGTTTDNSNFNRAPGNYCSGVPSFSFAGTNATGTGFNWNQSSFHSNSAHGSTSSTFAFAPLTSNIFGVQVNPASGNKTIFGIQSSSSGRTTCGGQSSNAFCFKTSDTSPTKPQPQAIVPQSNVASSMATCTLNLNSYSTLPFGPGESRSRPFDSTFSSDKCSSTVHAAQPSQDCADKAPSLSFQFPNNSSRFEVTNDGSIQEKDDTNVVLIEIREPDVLSVLPKVPDEYYTEPSVAELAAKEKAEPGFCSRVKDFGEN